MIAFKSMGETRSPGLPLRRTGRITRSKMGVFLTSPTILLPDQESREVSL